MNGAVGMVYIRIHSVTGFTVHESKDFWKHRQSSHKPAIQDPIQQDIVKIEVTRNPETIQAEMMPVPGMNFPEVPSANNRAVVMEISIGAIRIKANNQVNPKLLAETVRLLGSDATC